MNRTLLAIAFVFLFVNALFAQSASGEREAFLTWSASQCENIGKTARVTDNVGNSFTMRGLKTDRAVNYKMRATLMSPEVIRASARLEQLRNRLSDEQTLQLVKDAEDAGDLVIMIELDPNEGSGVIPLDWRAILQPRGLADGAEGAVSGIKSPQFRALKALNGTARRDYDYDVFWVEFPFTDQHGKANFSADVKQLELIVGVYRSEGRVFWQVPDSIRARIKSATGIN